MKITVSVQNIPRGAGYTSGFSRSILHSKGGGIHNEKPVKGPIELVAYQLASPAEPLTDRTAPKVTIHSNTDNKKSAQTEHDDAHHKKRRNGDDSAAIAAGMEAANAAQSSTATDVQEAQNMSGQAAQEAQTSAQYSALAESVASSAQQAANQAEVAAQSADQSAGSAAGSASEASNAGDQNR